MTEKLNDHVDELQPESMDDHLRGFDDRDDEPEDVQGPLEFDGRTEEDDDVEFEAGQDDQPTTALSRRGLLTGAGAAAGALAVGASSPLWTPAESAEAHGGLTRYCKVDGARTYYEANGNAACFDYNPTFKGRCNLVLDLWDNNTPSSYGRPWRVWTYGVHTDHRTSAAHNYGRGFDLTRIQVTINGTLRRRFYARYDRWKSWSSTAVRRERRWYWGTAAACHFRLRNVLTYYYNSAHHNHIHMDNLVSGTGNSTFSTGSKTQVQSVQAMCRWIWGKSTAIDGIWGSQTRQHSHEVLVRIGKGGYLTSSGSHWRAFNGATIRKAYGVQSY